MRFIISGIIAIHGVIHLLGFVKAFNIAPAKRRGIEGKVVVHCWVDSLGNVIKTEILQGVGYGLDESVMNAVKLTKFYPGTADGKAVNFEVIIPIVFKLHLLNPSKLSGAKTAKKIV
ncbi:MAG TPA: energy transducer TonB [Ignavibacteriaceae bacterium]|nr:energy transducer TonB [Ignavibacteriaceae bacterium]